MSLNIQQTSPAIAGIKEWVRNGMASYRILNALNNGIQFCCDCNRLQ
jgi:hypothetical protein